jgi:uncharacterized protein (DUF736 family)
MIIGKFQQEDGAYVGSIPAFAGPTLPVRIAPTDLKGIDYVVTISCSAIELGIGWSRVSEKKGTKYVSLKLDSPFLPAPANCALVSQKDGSFALLWDRPKPKEESEPGAEQAAA